MANYVTTPPASVIYIIANLLLHFVTSSSVRRNKFSCLPQHAAHACTSLPAHAPLTSHAHLREVADSESRTFHLLLQNLGIRPCWRHSISFELPPCGKGSRKCRYLGREQWGQEEGKRSIPLFHHHRLKREGKACQLNSGSRETRKHAPGAVISSRGCRQAPLRWCNHNRNYIELWWGGLAGLKSIFPPTYIFTSF